MILTHHSFHHQTKQPERSVSRGFPNLTVIGLKAVPQGVSPKIKGGPWEHAFFPSIKCIALI